MKFRTTAVTAALLLCCTFVFVPLGAHSASAATVEDYNTVATTVEDNTVAETYRDYLSETGIVGAPTVVCDVRTKEDLDALSEGERAPSNAILRIDGNCDVVAEQGEKLGSFDEIYTEILRGKIIPVLFLADRAAADAAVHYLKEERSILDLAVMSEDPALVKNVRTEVTQIRGIVSFPQETDPFEIVKTVNSSYANVAVLPQKFATQETVDFIQARFKTVWVVADGGGAMPYQRAIVSGACGIIAEQYNEVYETLVNSFPAGETYRTRMPYNVAHRGMGTRGSGANRRDEYHENSVSACKEAARVGATHLEVDAYVTTDDVIVMMHDADLSRTTDGTGNIESYSYSELLDFNLDCGPEDEKIPTLSQILDITRKEGIILVLEVKTQKTDIFLAAFKETVSQKSAKDGFDYWRQIVVISFSRDVITTMREQFPEVPTADLNSVKNVRDDQLLSRLSEWNTGVDATYTEAIPEQETMLFARGILSWYWTYNRFLPLEETQGQGVTNNDPRAEGIVRRIFKDDYELQEGETLYSGLLVKVQVEDYQGNVTEQEGSVAFFEKTGNGYVAIAKYETEQGVFFTDAFSANEPTGSANEPTGCGAVFTFSPLFPILFVPVLFRRRKQ